MKELQYPTVTRVLAAAKKRVRFYDIEWDTEGEAVDLPKELTLDVDQDLDVAMEGADVLSDKEGWTVHGFNFKIVKQ